MKTIGGPEPSTFTLAVTSGVSTSCPPSRAAAGRVAESTQKVLVASANAIRVTTAIAFFMTRLPDRDRDAKLMARPVGSAMMRRILCTIMIAACLTAAGDGSPARAASLEDAEAAYRRGEI